MRGSSTPDPRRSLSDHSTFVRRIARRLVKDPDEAEDLAQDTWLVALKREHSPPRAVGAWLAGVARNLAAFRARSRERRMRREGEVAQPEATSDVSDLHEESARGDEIRACVLSLNEPYRNAILLRYFENLTPGEIAVRQVVPLQTVRTRLKRGLRMLRAKLDRERADDSTLRSLWLAFLSDRNEQRSSPSSRGIRAGAMPTWVAVAGLVVGSVALFCWIYRETPSAAVVAGTHAHSSLADAGSGLFAPLAASPVPFDDRSPLDSNARELAISPPPPTTRVSGRVLDVDGRPAPGATVRVDRVRAFDQTVIELDELDRETTTDARGAFRLERVPTRFALSASTEDQVSAQWLLADVRGDEAIDDIEIPLVRRWALRGRVVDEAGSPVADAMVAAMTPLPGLRGRSAGFPRTSFFFREHSVQTDLDGRFTMPELAWTAVNLNVVAPRHAHLIERVEPGARDVVLRVRSGVSLSVVVVDSTPHSTASLDLSLYLTEGQPTPMLRGPQSGGPLVFEGLQAGAWCFLKVESDSSATEVVGPFRIARDMAPLFVTLRPARTLTGTVMLAGGAPLAGARVAASAPVDWDAAMHLLFWPDRLQRLCRMSHTITDATGRFELGGVARSAVLVEITPPGASDPIWTELVTPGVSSLDVRVDHEPEGPATIEGRVRDRATGHGLASFTVHALRLGGADTVRRVQARALDERGSFRLELPSAGGWSVYVSAPGFAPAMLYEVLLGSDRGDLDFELDRSREVSIRLVDRQRVPVPWAVLSLADVSGAPVLVPSRIDTLQTRVQSGPDGLVHLHALPARRIRMRVDVPELGYATLLDFDASTASAEVQELCLSDLDVSLARRVVELSLRTMAARDSHESSNGRPVPVSTAFEGRCRIEIRDLEGRFQSRWAGTVSESGACAEAGEPGLCLFFEPNGEPVIVFPEVESAVPCEERPACETVTRPSSIELVFPATAGRVLVEAEGFPAREFAFDFGADATVASLCLELGK